MAVRYSDEVRKDLKGTERTIKQLTNELVDKHKRRINRIALVSSIMVTGQRGQVHTDVASVTQEIKRLDQEIEILESEIRTNKQLLAASSKELKAAPARPRVRSQVASIGASGSRAITSAANEKPQPKSPVMAWDSAIAAALHTASKYNLTVIPRASLEIMGARLLDRYPTVRLIQKDGSYASVELAPTRKSVRQK